MTDTYHVVLHVTVLTLLLAALAIYHLVMGAIALLAPRQAARLVGAFYGATLGDSPQLRYATSMIGALAIAVGIAAGSAALHPVIRRPLVVALLVLQLARLFCRIRDRRLLAVAFGITPRRNAIMAAVLGVEIVILSLALR
ncbi:MAG: hypothetical protein HOQ09_10960 [Gemmatimonadaceae bacterium]|nr:hypothetical protein [Gemmatimonadaceae bacterium]